MHIKTDVLIVGCGIAGAVAALRLAQDREREILVITRTKNAEECNTRYAQGGIIGRTDADPDSLERDVIEAGGGLCDPRAVRILAEEGPRLVQEILVEGDGVPFDREDGGALAYTREGGHSENRILHVGDATGHAIMRTLVERLREQPNVRLQTEWTAVDLITSSHHATDLRAIYDPITCYGAYVLDRDTGTVQRVLAPATVLATGGFCRIYRYSTNPEGARGSGLAMAHRAGARVINTEYVQFHPTTLAVRGMENFLISEAVRGEGGRLYTPAGEPFMQRYAPEWGDLAPRDIVARAIHHEMIKHEYPHVLLDIGSNMPADRIPERFPTIYETCKKAGIDITSEPIPVVPAAHYACGGVKVDGWGRTTVQGLYAVGEVSCTGLHGANRLASTSLLEGLVWGDRAGRDIANRSDLAPPNPKTIPPWQNLGGANWPDPVLIHHDARIIQNTMWFYVGLSRNSHRLKRALRDLAHLMEMIDEFYRSNQLTDDLVNLRNMAQVAQIVTNAAWHNRNSYGSHYREDGGEPQVATFFDD